MAIAGKVSGTMPVAFFGHGSPMNTLEKNQHTLAWERFGVETGKPTGIVCVSAHWFTRGTAVTAMAQPRTIHDFGGFPQALYEVRYPAAGSPALAARVKSLLAPVNVLEDTKEWGLDHGAWSILVHVYPQADIPVIQLSIDATQPPEYHYRMAQRLAPLRDEGVLLMGSGNVVHNLGAVDWAGDAAARPWASEFNATVRGRLAANDDNALLHLEQLGSAAALSVPTLEHYLPLVYIVALRRPTDGLRVLTDGVELGAISMLSVAFGEALGTK